MTKQAVEYVRRDGSQGNRGQRYDRPRSDICFVDLGGTELGIPADQSQLRQVVEGYVKNDGTQLGVVFEGELHEVVVAVVAGIGAAAEIEISYAVDFFHDQVGPDPMESAAVTDLNDVGLGRGYFSHF